MAIVSLLRAHPHNAVRDPERTRERILAAALREFSAHGFAGARVDRIARRARINKRMLYHYFGNKEGLFKAILSRKLGERLAWAAATPGDPGESLAFWFDITCRDPDWVRLLQWEALEGGPGTISRESERQRAFKVGVDQLRVRQARGLLRADLDPRQTLLAMMALTMFPVAFPQITRLATGLRPKDPTFRKQRVEFLRRFAGALLPERARPAARGSAGSGGRS
jgi:TetR/AcrR family transcriptional regulator